MSHGEIKKTWKTQEVALLYRPKLAVELVLLAMSQEVIHALYVIRYLPVGMSDHTMKTS